MVSRRPLPGLVRSWRALTVSLVQSPCRRYQPRGVVVTPAGSGRGHVGVVVKSHLGAWSGFHATVGLVSVRWNHGAIHA